MNEKDGGGVSGRSPRLTFRTSLGRWRFEVLLTLGASERLVCLYLSEVRQSGKSASGRHILGEVRNVSLEGWETHWLQRNSRFKRHLSRNE